MMKINFLASVVIAALVFTGCGKKENAKPVTAETVSVEASAAEEGAPVVEQKKANEAAPIQPAAETKPVAETIPADETIPAAAAPAGDTMAEAGGPGGEQEGFQYRIAGTGNSRHIIITGYTGTNTVISIPASIDNIPVTVIGEGAFENKNVRALTLPAGLTEIGPRAFSGNSLTKLEIPGTVTAIGAGAFAENSLRSLVIPQGITVIEDEAFSYNDLTELTLPQGLRSIGNEAFAILSSSFFGEPAKLSRIGLPSSLTSIGNEAFANHDISELVLPPGVKYVGEYAFNGNPVTKISIGSGVELEQSAISSEDSTAFVFGGMAGLTLTDENGNEISPLASFTYTYDQNDMRGGVYAKDGSGKWIFTAK
ncbi:MAG: leucine-rich repeat protein [Treponema sp.]|jgi:hypothetical protein|nr:leucine-rich repeat protein [Treponema sp.]